MKLIQMVNQHYQNLTDVELIILEFISKHNLDYDDLSIDDLSKLTHTSKSSIVRLSQKLGFSGFSEFKYFLKYNKEQSARLKPNGKDYLILLKHDIEATLKYLASIDFSELSQALLKADNIYAIGTGYSENLYMNDLARSFLTSHVFITVFPSITELFWNLDAIGENDLIIACSYSGNDQDLLMAMNRLKSNKVTIVSITPMRTNELSEIANLSYYYVETPLNINASTYKEFNFYATLKILIDTIYRSYLDYNVK